MFVFTMLMKRKREKCAETVVYYVKKKKRKKTVRKLGVHREYKLFFLSLFAGAVKKKKKRSRAWGL